MSKGLSEFGFIDSFCSNLGVTDESVILGVGDDAALIDVPPGHSLAVSTDTMNEGQHFFADANPSALAHKLLHVNLSDMAAMGAIPRWATLSASLPALDQSWIELFFKGMQSALLDARVRVIGGDTTKGPRSFTLTIMGLIPEGGALKRSTAQIGDGLYVSGSVGGAALGLYLEKARRDNHASIGKTLLLSERDQLALTRLHLPRARLDLATSLLGHTHACIDVSDGLVGDLHHILRASSVDAEIDWDRLPIDSALRERPELSAQQVEQMALNGGEDYELLFTRTEAQHQEWLRLHPELAAEVTQIGRIIARTEGNADSTVTLRDNDHSRALTAASFEHF